MTPVSHAAQALTFVNQVHPLRCGPSPPFSRYSSTKDTTSLSQNHHYRKSDCHKAITTSNFLPSSKCEGGPALVGTPPQAEGPLRALAPLDGSVLAKAALVPAAQLISALAAPDQARSTSRGWSSCPSPPRSARASGGPSCTRPGGISARPSNRCAKDWSPARSQRSSWPSPGPSRPMTTSPPASRC